MNGIAELVFARARGRTILTKSRVEAPMAVVRPFGLPDGGVLMQIVSLGPGLCAGDRINVDVRAGRGTRVAITTTAATRVMSMDQGAYAEQRITLHAEEDAVMEYYPCVTIPYPGSALRQTIDAHTAPSARIGVLECWAMGRTARSEYLAFRSLASRMTIAAGGRRTYVDAMRLEPESTDLAGAGILAGGRYLACGVWTGVGRDLDDEPAGPASDSDPLVAFATSSPGVGYLRVLGSDGPGVEAVIRASVERVWRIWGLAPVCLSRFHN